MSEMRNLIEAVVGPRVNDDWFKEDSFLTFKKPIAIKYEIAKAPGNLETLEGVVKYDKGDYIITGPKGEQYPVSPETFENLYDNDNGYGSATPKKIFKKAKLADHNGVIHTSWGDLEYTKGNDYIVRHGDGDYGVVKKDIFPMTYDTSKVR